MALLFFPSSPHGWVPVLTAGLTIIGNVGYATSIVCANAFLPGLAREDPAVLQGVPEIPRQGERGGDEEEGQALLSNLAELALSSERLAVDDRERLGHPMSNGADSETSLSLAMSRISATGTAIGFGSGVTVLGLLLIPVVIDEGSTKSLCLAIGLSGLWWSVFTVPAWIGLPTGSQRTEKAGATPSLFGSLGTGWSRVGRMIHPQEVRKLPNLFTFLLAWIFLSDGESIMYYVYLNLTPGRLPHHNLYCDLVCLIFTTYAAFQGHLHRHPGPARSSLLVHPRTTVSETSWVDQSENATAYRFARGDYPVLCVSWNHLAFRRLEDRVGDVHCSYILRDGECTMAFAGALALALMTFAPAIWTF